jgi:hypothetical protein
MGYPGSLVLTLVPVNICLCNYGAGDCAERQQAGEQCSGRKRKLTFEKDSRFNGGQTRLAFI